MKDLVPFVELPPALQEYDRTRLETLKRSPKRSLNAVNDTFDLIGGVPRLAIWADENPTDFYTKIWNRTLQTNAQVEHSGEITIRTAIPRGPLDGDFTDVTPEPSDE
jgi:hypothetical protein